MIELCMPAGGFWGVAICGVLQRLREKGFVPDVISGVSSGAHAPYLIYGNSDRETVLTWFEFARSFIRSNRWRSLIPTLKSHDDELYPLIKPFLKENSVFRDQGIKKFFVGYTAVPSFNFVIEDIISHDDIDRAGETILKSSSIPFMTGPGLHFRGGIDGIFRKPAFIAPLEKTPTRILLTYNSRYGDLTARCAGPWDKILRVDPGLPIPLMASTKQISHSYDLGYRQGDQLSEQIDTLKAALQE